MSRLYSRPKPKFPEPHLDSAEKERIQRVFQEVDKWVDHDSGYVLNVAFQANRARDGTFLGQEVAQEFQRILQEGDGKFDDGLVAVFSDNTKASDLYFRYKFLIRFLQAGRGKESVGTFVQAISEDRNSNYSAIPPADRGKVAWELLWHVLHFHHETVPQASSYKQQMDLFFPQANNSSRLTTFSICLKDLERVDLRVKPTRDYHEHLVIDGDTVNVYQLMYGDVNTLLNYDKNKAAKALGIADLGTEIRASLYSLYGKDEFYGRAEELELFKPEDQLQRSLCARFLQLSAGAKPNLLAYRVQVLQKHLDHRGAWWPSLCRDLKKQSQTQPLHFYGTIFAVFFGICTVIQTVAAVWSLFRV